jgi:hypothetical protein
MAPSRRAAPARGTSAAHDQADAAQRGDRARGRILNGDFALTPAVGARARRDVRRQPRERARGDPVVEALGFLRVIGRGAFVTDRHWRADGRWLDLHCDRCSSSSASAAPRRVRGPARGRNLTRQGAGHRGDDLRRRRRRDAAATDLVPPTSTTSRSPRRRNRCSTTPSPTCTVPSRAPRARPQGRPSGRPPSTRSSSRRSRPRRGDGVPAESPHRRREIVADGRASCGREGVRPAPGRGG